MRLLFSVPCPQQAFPLTGTGYRYYVDLKNGCFIYVFPDNLAPPPDFPLIEIPAEEVENYLLKED